MHIKEYLTSFRGRLTTLVVCAILVPMIISSFLLGGMLDRELQKSFENRLEAELETFSLILNTKEKELTQGLLRVASDNTLQMTLNLEIIPQLRKYLDTQIEVLGFSSLVVADVRKKILATSGKPILDFIEDNDESQLITAGTDTFICHSKPIFRNNELLGYVLGAVNLKGSGFLEFLSEKLVDNYAMWINGELVVSDLTTGDLDNNFQISTDGNIMNSLTGENKFRVLTEKLDFGNRELTYGILLPLEAKAKKFRTMLGIIAAFVLSLFLIILTLLKRFMRELINPVNQLTRAASNIDNGEEIPYLDDSRNDEFGKMAFTFKRMVENLKNSEQELKAHRDNLQESVKERTVELEAEIVERKKIEETLKKAKKEAESANRAKSEFLANMSHEIRTPMNGIFGMTELLSNAELTNEHRECLNMLRLSSDNMLAVINDILDFSKIEAGKLDLNPIDFNLRDNLGATLKTIDIRAREKGLKLALDVQTNVPDTLRGDLTRLQQVIVNLAGNAVKFTDRGEIIVYVESESQTEDVVTLHFAVSDTGMGVPEKNQKHIFEAFTQVDGSSTREVGGTGLGLSISSELVRMMNGKIWVESEVGKGSTFHFTARFGIVPELEKQELPEEIAKSEYEFSNNRYSSNADRKKVHILLAEDNDISREFELRILKRQGYAVEVANNGEEALESLKEKHFDIVLMDVQMPKMDGIEATQAIRSSTDNTFNPEIPIIAVTAHAFEEEKEKCLKAGMNSCVIKPFESEELFKEIEKLVQAEDMSS